MARFGVRSGSVAFARSKKIPANSPFERTGANARQLLPCRRSWVRVPSSAFKGPADGARKMRQNLGGAIGYKSLALPIAAGVFEPFG
jgi:hypothetical protein